MDCECFGGFEGVGEVGGWIRVEALFAEYREAPAAFGCLRMKSLRKVYA